MIEFIDRGEALRLQGRTSQALAELEYAWSLAEKDTDPAIKARASGALGALYLVTQRRKDGEGILQRSIQEAQAAHLPRVAAASYNHLGLAYAARRNFTEARAAYQKGLALAREANDPEIETAIRINTARTMEPTERFEALIEADAVARRVDSPQKRALLLMNIGREARLLRQADKAKARKIIAFSHKLLNEAMAIADSLDEQRLYVLAKGNMGALYESQGRLREALGLTDQAIRMAEHLGSDDLGLQWQWQRGRLRRALGDTRGALAAYRHAIRHIQTIRYDIPVEYIGGRSAFREMLEPVYLSATDLMLAQSGRERNPQEVQALLSEARNTIELLKAAELNDYFQDPCVADPLTDTGELDKIDPKTAVFYPIILPDRLELLVGFHDTKRRVAIPVTADTVRKAAHELAQRLRPQEGGLQEHTQASARIYQWLIAPIEPWLRERQIDTIVFVPDGALRMIPLAALFDGKNFVLERYAVATVPGMTLLDARPQPREDLRSLLAGLSESVQGFSELPGVNNELNALQGLLPSQKLFNNTFVHHRLQNEVHQNLYRVVHIASHGVFGGTPEASFILTYDGRLNMNQLEELMQRHIEEKPIELLTLSACQTAEGDDRAPLGLGGVALKAGVRSALGSLWMVSDRAAQKMIPTFYENLRAPGMTKAKALQQAQLQLLQEKDLAHPFFWAPFILIGNWL